MTISTRAVPIGGKQACVDKVDGTATPAQPLTPPPSLSHTYHRSTLLSLATPPSSVTQQDPSAPLPRRLSSFAPILRCSVALSESEWGVSEDNSSLLDGQPISKDLPIPAHLDGEGAKHPADRASWSRAGRSDSGSASDSSELLFHYSSYTESRPAPAPLPVLIDFQNPFGAAVNAANSGTNAGNDDHDRPVSLTDSPMLVDSGVTTTTLNKGADNDGVEGRSLPSRAQMMGIQTQPGSELLHPQPKSHLNSVAATATVNATASANLPIRLGSGPLSRKSSTSNSGPNVGGSASLPPAPAFAGQTFPSSVNSSTTSLSSMRMGPREQSVADIRANLLSTLGAPRSRSDSDSSLNSEMSSVSSSAVAVAGVEGKLNPFAPPFPLPSTEPSKDRAVPTVFTETQASLPLPRPTSLAAALGNAAGGTSAPSGGGSIPLPSSLPARPGPLPPVFVKRESSALPQPMALRDVAPLGKDWEGDHTISGNEKRRRASQVSIQSTSNPTSGQGLALASGLGNSLGLPAAFGSSLGPGPNGSMSRRGSTASISDNTGLGLGLGLGGGSGRNSPALSRAGSSSGNRPERLVRLGQGLRSHSPQPQSRRGSTSLAPHSSSSSR
ncbi:hypothetical protein IAU59_001251 [Kwoniella sp. CBS 9459]